MVKLKESFGVLEQRMVMREEACGDGVQMR